VWFRKNSLAGNSIECERMRRITSEILGAAMDEELKVAAADEELGAAIDDGGVVRQAW
jgi:hypothetical protein